jgi:hypothetical protein
MWIEKILDEFSLYRKRKSDLILRELLVLTRLLNNLSLTQVKSSNITYYNSWVRSTNLNAIQQNWELK